LNLQSGLVKNSLIIAAIAVAVILYAWYRWHRFINHREQATDANREITWLEELAREYEQGGINHRERLEWLIDNFESKHEPSAEIARRLENVRRILGKGAGITSSRR
jgi:hypothetical protein